eukprot:4907205-Pyramimonas_sp.AAC.1
MSLENNRMSLECLGELRFGFLSEFRADFLLPGMKTNRSTRNSICFSLGVSGLALTEIHAKQKSAAARLQGRCSDLTPATTPMTAAAMFLGAPRP